ncbi:MAG TPA: heme ABC exporter ATP-binding protein CcmA [Thermoanaerobaculia bacterium]|nr:heme ABC exporter ATP-binding protein CcmA [Thermoanaerobaculia bacterium]HQR67110.1 heme ABC exporter ATP-binding protein CcmA [Thermoanaerobaculia bacterium]
MDLVAENLTRSFGRRRVVGPLSFRVAPGRVLGVAGPNGSGKTTLVRTLAGLIRPTTGGVFLEDGDGRRSPRDAADAIGWVAPDLSLYGELTARENLQFFAKLHGRPAAPAWADEAIAGVGLDPARIAATPLHALSTGQRQRIKLVYATLHHPAVLFLDEPSSNLDDAGRAVVARVVAEQRTRGVAVVASNDAGDLALADERVTL